MDYSPKNMQQYNNNFDKEITFLIQKYRFKNVVTKPNELTKTCIQKKLTSEQLNLLTKLFHKNIIGLKKIGKSKKNSSQAELFWLYYQSIPFSLETILTKSQFDVRPQTLQAALLDIKNYLFSLKISPEFQQYNIGVNQNGVIKVYISAQDILKNQSNHKKIQDCDKKIKQIKGWYSNQYSRRSLKPSQRPKLITQTRLSQSKLNKLVQIKCDFEKIRKNIKSEQTKNNSFIAPAVRPVDDKNINVLYKNEQPKLFTINIYDQNPKGQRNNRQNINYDGRQLANKYIKSYQNNYEENQKQIEKQKYIYDYDDQSVDTYRMELGQDFEMPSIRTNQKLRQTFSNKKSWDTLTYKSPKNMNKKRKIHQSAGKKDFLNILQNNKNMIKQIQAGRIQKIEDNKTVQQNHIRPKNWQSSTIKSTLPPNIQDRVQQALTKTKNVMELLRNSNKGTPTYK